MAELLLHGGVPSVVNKDGIGGYIVAGSVLDKEWNGRLRQGDGGLWPSERAVASLMAAGARRETFLNYGKQEAYPFLWVELSRVVNFTHVAVIFAEEEEEEEGASGTK